MRNYVVIFLVTAVIVVPLITYGALVPCGNEGQLMCNACFFVNMMQGIMVWLVGIMIAVITFVFAWAGLKIVMSGGESGSISEARSMMTNAVVGLIILLSAWLVVDTVLKIIVESRTGDGGNSQLLGMWNTIECKDTPVVAPPRSQSGSGVQTVPGTTQGCIGECIPIPSGIAIKSTACAGGSSKCTVSSQLAPQLETLDKKLDTHSIGWTVTEAYPPTVSHQNECHSNGTCVDVSLTSPTIENTKKFMDEAKASNLRAVYEGLDCSVRDTLKAQGYEAYCKSDSGYGHITGVHFSVYKK
jgi:hypothetical protein